MSDALYQIKLIETITCVETRLMNRLRWYVQKLSNRDETLRGFTTELDHQRLLIDQAYERDLSESTQQTRHAKNTTLYNFLQVHIATAQSRRDYRWENLASVLSELFVLKLTISELSFEDRSELINEDIEALIDQIQSVDLGVTPADQEFENPLVAASMRIRIELPFMINHFFQRLI